MTQETTSTALEELLKPTELLPGLTTEEITATYFDKDALREPPYRLHRLDGEGHRYYYVFEDGEPKFFPSVTTLLRQVMPTSPFLIKWMVQNGEEGATEKRDLAAAYGTYMHIQFERLIINRKFDFDAVPDELREYIKFNALPDKVFYTWLDNIRKDVLAFALFIKDYNVRPLAVEIGLYHPDYRYAGCVDLPCRMTYKKKEITAIIDFKSGRKGFWEEHELQLGLYKMMWDVNFPDTPCERVFNFAPKDWRTGPTYTLKDQTDSPNLAKIPHLLNLAMIEDEKRENTIAFVSGQLDLDAGDPKDCFTSLSLAEFIKAKAEKPENSQIKPVDGVSPLDRGNTLFDD